MGCGSCRCRSEESPHGCRDRLSVTMDSGSDHLMFRRPMKGEGGEIRETGCRVCVSSSMGVDNGGWRERLTEAYLQR